MFKHKIAACAGFLVVIVGSAAFLYSLIGLHSFEFMAAGAAFAGGGLYLLLGRNPPPAGVL